jgi:hypothetical protein
MLSSKLFIVHISHSDYANDEQQIVDEILTNSVQRSFEKKTRQVVPSVTPFENKN